MIPGAIWLIKLILSHLLTDFILQPSSWIKSRNKDHFASRSLYYHGFITASLAYIFIGWKYWLVAIIILITHIVIDGWKSNRPYKIRYFLLDQFFHGLVIVGCWWLTFKDLKVVQNIFQRLNSSSHYWLLLAGFVFVTNPAGILIGQLTSQWSRKVDDDNNSLAHAGKWIGIIERVIVLILVLHDQYSAIGLLVAAKGIIRFSEKDRQEIKTEYLVIGTLLSIGIAVVTGIIIKLSI